MYIVLRCIVFEPKNARMEKSKTKYQLATQNKYIILCRNNIYNNKIFDK